MDALLTGTGGADGWPQPGCRCSSCMLGRSAGTWREPGRVVIDGALEFRAAQPVRAIRGSHSPASHRVEQVAGGWDVTGPDGGRLLLAAGPGQSPQPPAGAAPYDLALLDLLASPAQLGQLRSAGLVHARTAVAALCTDHRVSTPAELARRCELWRVCQGYDGQLITVPLPQEPGSGPVRPHRTLVVGGARSGKSTEAELRLAAEPRVTYLAAGPWQSWTGADGQPDTEWADRVARHRARRPPWWQTVESLDLAGWLRRETGALLIDGIGTWLAGIMDQAGLWREGADGVVDPADEVRSRIADLIGAWRQTAALVVAVTDEVGSGLVPPYPAGRVFRDELGWLNQQLAAESELSLHVVAGRPVPLGGGGH